MRMNAMPSTGTGIAKSLISVAGALALGACSAVAQNPDDTTVMDIDSNEIDAAASSGDNELIGLEAELEAAADKLEAEARVADREELPLSRWRYVASDRTAIMFIDGETVRTASVSPIGSAPKQGRHFWIMHFEIDARTKQLSQHRQFWRADCGERTMAISEVVTHSRAGEILARSRASGAFRPVIPETFGEEILRWVCVGPTLADWAVAFGESPWKVADRYFALAAARVEGPTAVALALRAGTSPEQARRLIETLPVPQRLAARRAVGLN